MGVYKLFPSLLNKYKNRNIIFTKKEKSIDVDELYIDTNCLLHPKCFEIALENPSLIKNNPEKLERMMIIHCIKYIEQIIKLVNPSKMVYISIDGVAPYAKNKQQHSRRYKTVFDNKIKKKLCSKYGKDYIESWNNSAITPGTKFMSKITSAIISYLKLKQKIKSSENKVKYVFSSASTPGEGEHKILQEIKKSTSKNKIIYGLDSDLIYLAMASEINDIYLLREITEFQKIDKSELFCYMSIDDLKECFYEESIESLYVDNMESIQFENINNYKKEIIRDHIILGSFLGNDFLHSLPSVNLKLSNKMSGLNIINKAWKHVFQAINEFRKDYIFLVSDDLKFNYEFFKEIFAYFSSLEDEYFISLRKTKKKKVNLEYTNYEDHIKDWENMNFYVPDIFKLGCSFVPFQDAKQNYYQYYEISDVNEMVEQYILGLSWNLHYYFNKCPDYLWCYPFDSSPFVSDIYSWIVLNESKFNDVFSRYIYGIELNKNMITPLEQLLIVLPPQSRFLLPKKYASIMLNNPEMFPEKIKLDFQGINKMYQAHALVKIPDVLAIKSLTFDIKLSEKEEALNKFKKEYTIYI